MLAGFEYIRTRRRLLGVITLDLFVVMLGGATALLPIYARDILQVGPIGLGLLRSAPAAGALITAMLLSRHPVERHIGPKMFAVVAIYGISDHRVRAVDLVSAVAAALAVLGAADALSIVIRFSLVQIETPDAMRGRVSAINYLFVGSSNTLGDFASGVDAARLGAVASVLIGGIGSLLVAGIWMFLFPDLRRIDRYEPADQKRSEALMHILITGAAGMIGRKLTERLVIDRALGGQPIDKLTLIDIVAPARPAGFSDHVKTRAADLAAAGVADKAVAERPDVIFHLAGVVSGEAETDFEKGYRVNLDGTRALLEAVRAVDGYKPKFVFTSSIAVFGAPFPDAIPDEFHLTPLTSYGTQKAICELLLADYTRRGFLDGVGIRLPSIVRAAGQAKQGCLRILLRHHPRAARRPGGDPAGCRQRAALARQPALGGRVSYSCRRTVTQQTRRPHQPHACRASAARWASRLRRSSASPATRSPPAFGARRTSWWRASSPAGRAASIRARAGARIQGGGDLRRHHSRAYRG